MVTILNPVPRNQTFGQKLASGVGKGLEMGQQLYDKHLSEQRLKEENEAAKKLGINLSGIRDPKMRQEALSLALQGKNKQAEKSLELVGNKREIEGLEDLYGMERGSLSKFTSNPQLAASAAKPPKEPVRRLSEKPIDPEQKAALSAARSVPGFDEMDEVDQYRTMVDSGVSPELAEKESKLTSSKLEREQKGFESSYKSQEDFINNTTNSYKAFETETKPRLLQMQKLATDDDLISPTAAQFLDLMGIPLGALEDPSSELYNKLSLDLLKGLPETYGNKIMKVEVDNFLKTIPTLLNSADGRRMIASNVLKLGEMKEVYYNEMRNQQRDSLDNNKKLPRDFQQRVFDQVKPQVDRLNNEFVKLSEIKHVPPGTVPFFNPMGQIEFVPKEHVQWAMENGGRKIW